MKTLPFGPNAPVILFVFYKDSLMSRRKEWKPLSIAAAGAGFRAVVSTWEALAVDDGMVQAGEVFVCKPGSAEFVEDIDVAFKPAVVMTTWGTRGYADVFSRILSLGVCHSEHPLISRLDGKCELERCLRDYERSTGHVVSRPPTWTSDDLVRAEALPPGSNLFVILKPSGSGKCNGVEIVPRDSIGSLAREVSEGKRPPFVVQELVDDVFLYNGRRWDIRVNVLATSLSPLRYHFHPQGVAKTAGAAAHPGSIALDEWLNADSFLEGRQQAENLALSDMLEHIAGEYMPLEGFWARIDELVGHVFSAIALQAETEHLSPDRAFMYPGFDFIVEREGADGYAVRLLEINSHPGLGWDPHVTEALMLEYRSWFDALMTMATEKDRVHDAVADS